MKRPNLNRTVGLALALLAAAGPLAAQDAAGGARVVTLEQAIRTAVEQNRDLQWARLGLDAAEARVREAWGSVYPKLDLDANYTRNLKVPVNFLPKRFVDPDAGPDELVGIRFGTDNQWHGQLRFEQPVFQAAAFVGVGAAGRYRSLQREVVRGTALQVATRARIAYYDALLAEEAARLNENSVRRVRQTLAETQAMQRAGLASEYDVLRLQVELGNLEPALRRARNAAVAARRQLAVEMGMDGGDSLQVVGSLAALRLDPEAEADETSRGILAVAGVRSPETVAAEELVAQARRGSSEMRQLESTAELRRAELRAEQSQYLPKVTLVGTYSYSAQENGSPDFFGSADSRFNAQSWGLQVSMPVFSGLQRPARVAQNRAALRQAQTQTRLAEAKLENGVRTLRDAVVEAHERVEGQQRAVTLAKRGFEIAAAQYREGLGSQLEVTDAEVALRQTEFNYAQAVYDYLAARARLDEAVGAVPGVL